MAKNNDRVRNNALKDRMNDQAKGIVSQVTPETEKYFENLAERLGINAHIEINNK